MAVGAQAESPSGRRAPVFLAVAGIAVTALVALPLVYLAVRAGSGGGDAWDVLVRARTLELIGRTLLLVTAVTAAAAAIGVLAGNDSPEAARRFAEYLLSREGQTYFAEKTAEYPLAAGV